jgi:hypothetical protein
MRLLGVEAVADRLGISSVTARRLTAAGKLRHVRRPDRAARGPAAVGGAIIAAGGPAAGSEKGVAQ